MISLTEENIKNISNKLREPLKDCLGNFYDENIEHYEQNMLLLGMLYQINEIYKITAHMIIDSTVDKKIAKKMLNKLISEDLLKDFK